VKQIALANYRKARIWVEELPDAIVEASSMIPLTIAASNQRATSRKLCIEFSTPFANSPYGLLGGTLVPDNTGQLAVTVGYELESSRKRFHSPLGNSWDKIYAGLPKEYAGAVAKGVLRAQEWATPPAGRLTIDHAAHAESGSSAWLFEHLAIILMRLFAVVGEELTDDRVRSVFTEGIPSSTG
jgi:hypothetical protein